jgi:hypothetical protein
VMTHVLLADEVGVELFHEGDRAVSIRQAGEDIAWFECAHEHQDFEDAVAQGLAWLEGDR